MAPGSTPGSWVLLQPPGTTEWAVQVRAGAGWVGVGPDFVSEAAARSSREFHEARIRLLTITRRGLELRTQSGLHLESAWGSVVGAIVLVGAPVVTVVALLRAVRCRLSVATGGRGEGE